MSKPKKNITEYRRYDFAPDFPLITLSGDRWKLSDIKADRLHFHNCLEIGVCLSSEGFLDFGDKTVHYKAGDFTIIPRNIPHTTYSAQGEASLWEYIFVDTEMFFKHSNKFNDIARLITSSVYYILNKETSANMYNIITAIIDEASAKKPGYMVYIRGLMTALLIDITRLEKNSNVSSSQVHDNSALAIAPALNYISENYMYSFQIEDLAAMCHLSMTHFRRTFNMLMNMSPLEFVNSTRIDHACVLLQGSDTSILEISEMVGFHSVSSFNRTFSNLLGTSPREWRKNHQQGEALVKKQSVLEYRGWL